MKKDLTKTRLFQKDEIKREVIHNNLLTVASALEERGYNPVQQIVGYLISNDPAYISAHRNARSIIQQVDRNEIIEELVKFYLESR